MDGGSARGAEADLNGDTEIAACDDDVDEAIQTVDPHQLRSGAEKTGLLEPLEDFPFHLQDEHKSLQEYEHSEENLEDFEDEDEDMPMCNVEVSVELEVEEDEEVAVGLGVEGDDEVSDGGVGGKVPFDGGEDENDGDGTCLKMKPDDDPDEDCVAQCHSSDNDGCDGDGGGGSGSDEWGGGDSSEDEDGPRGEEGIDNIDMWVGHQMEVGSSDEDDADDGDADPDADATRSQSQSRSEGCEGERPRKRRRRRIGEVPDEPYAPSESSDSGSGSGGGGGEDSDSDYEYYSDVEKAHLRRKKAFELDLDLTTTRRIYVPLFLPSVDSLPPRSRDSSSPWVTLERPDPSELSSRGIPIPQPHPHRCHQCWENFSKDSDLKAHVKEMHPDPDPDPDPGAQSESSPPAPVYECPLSFCRSRWKDRGKLHRHFWINHPEEKSPLIPQRKSQSWPCPQSECKEVAPLGGKYRLLKHMWSVHPREAKEWEKQNIFKSGVNAIGEVWKSRLPVECPHCGVTLGNIRTLRKHLRARHSNANQDVYPAPARVKGQPGQRLSKMPVDCPQCGKTFANRRNLRDHLKNVHLIPNPSIEDFQPKPKSNENANDRNVSVNANANVNVLDLEGLINGNERLSGPGVPLRCPHCGERYSNIRDLREHARERHPNASNQFYAPAKVKGLQLAKMPVDCPQCGKTFANRRNLRDHLKNVHNPNSEKSLPKSKSNENPTEEGVTATVVSGRSKKSAAAKTWASRQPVDCPHCLKTISTICYLRTHIQTLHPEADTSISMSTTDGNDTDKTVMAASAKSKTERQRQPNPNPHATDDEDEDEDAEKPKSNTKTANSKPKLNKPKSRSRSAPRPGPPPTSKVEDEVLISQKAKKSSAAKTWPSRQPVECPHCPKTITIRHLSNHIQRKHPNAADTSAASNTNGYDSEPQPNANATDDDDEDGQPYPSKANTEAVNLPSRPPWRCPISTCERLLRNKILLTTHMESKHPDTDVDVIPQDQDRRVGRGSSREKPEKEFQCTNCKKESFDRHSKLVAHMKTCAQRPGPATSRRRSRSISRQNPTRTRTRIIAIAVGSGKRKIQNQKNQKDRRNSKDKDWKFRCYFCPNGMGMGSLEELVKHTALHTGECLLSCPRCKARFRHEFLFNVHTQVCLNFE